MIEVASHPADLSAWDPGTQPFYLEVFGETRPHLDMNYAERVLTGSPAGAATQPETHTSVYEYWWTIGHPGTPDQHHHWLPDFKHSGSLWSNLDDVAARVYLYFPINAGWRIKEVAANVKYLSPVEDEQSITAQVGADWERIQPFVEGAGNLAQKLGSVPGLGLAAAGAAPMLSALAQLKVGSIPQGAKGFEWSVAKTTFNAHTGQGVMQGVMWTLPKRMFETLGGRLTGSLAVTFIPANARAGTPWVAKPASLLAHIAVYANGSATWLPGEDEFVALPLAPTADVTALDGRSAPVDNVELAGRSGVDRREPLSTGPAGRAHPR